MSDKSRLYLFTLEVTPLAVGETYNPLPSHLTLMPRFWSTLLPEEITRAVEPLFQQTHPIQLFFGGTAFLGPQKVDVHVIEDTPGLKELHAQLLSILDTLNVTYTAPQWIGDNHKPHVTRRAGVTFAPGYTQMTAAAYLIEVAIQGKDHLRHIRTKFDLKG